MLNLKTLLFLIAVFAGLHSFGQTTVRIDEFNWTISIPEGFTPLTAEQTAAVQEKGRQAMEEVNEIKIEEETNTLLAFTNEVKDYIDATYNTFTKEDIDNLDQIQAEVRNITYNTFVEQMPGTTIDSSHYNTMISGLKFEVFQMIVKLSNGMQMDMRMFSRLFGNKQLAVNILLVGEPDKENVLLAAFEQSKFK